MLRRLTCARCRRELISVGGGGGGMLGGQCTVAADANTQVPPKARPLRDGLF